MAHHIFRRGGIPVLVSLASDMPLPLLCSLVAKHSETHQQATIVLQFRIELRGFDDEQPIDLLYNADNLIASAASLKPATLSLPQALLDPITRNKGADMRVLSLQLKEPCVVRCPPSAETIAPPKVLDMRFNQLAGLAKATRVHILFDHDWLHPIKAARFQQIITNPESLSAFVEESELQQADWTVFNPRAEAPPAFDAPPPAYDEASKKRLRRLSSPKSSSSPRSKRVLLSPAPIFPPSPTEKATTTTATPSPRPQSSPYTAPPILQEAVNTALATMLPSALQAILPDMLARLLAAPPPSPSSSISTSHPAQQIAPLSPLHHLLRAHLTAHTDTLAQKMTADLLEHATELRNTTELDLQEDLADHRVDVAMLKEDGLRDIDRMFDRKLEEFRESAAGIVESVEDQTLGVYDVARERLGAFVEREKEALARERAELERERRRIRDLDRGRERGSNDGVGVRRSASAPVGW